MHFGDNALRGSGGQSQKMEVDVTFLDSLSDAVLALASEFEVAYANAAARSALGCDLGALQGSSLWTRVPSLVPMADRLRATMQDRVEVAASAVLVSGRRFDMRALPWGQSGVLLVLRAAESEGAGGRSDPGAAIGATRGSPDDLYHLFMQLPALVSLTQGPEHVLQIINEPARALLGGRSVVGRPIADGLPELQAQGFVALLDGVYRTGVPFQRDEMAVSLDRGDGQHEERFFNVVYQPHRDSSGAITGILSCSADVTEQVRSRHRIEELAAELSRREGLLRTLTNNTDLALFFMDDQQKCTFMNAAAEAMTGHAAADVLAANKPLHDLIHYKHPDGRPYPMEECPIDRALPQRAREKGEDIFVHAEGHFYPVAFTASPIIEKGRAIGTVIEARDTSEEKRREAEREHLNRELTSSELRYRSLVDATSQIVWTNSAEGEMTAEQPGWSGFTGQTFEQYHGYGWSEAVHPDDREKTIRAWRHSVDTRTVFLCEHRVRRQDGVYRQFAIRAVPVLEENGSVREWVGIHTDVTEARELEEQRARLSRVVEESSDFIAFTDLWGRVLYLNEAANQFLGITNGKAYCGALSDFFLPEDGAVDAQVMAGVHEVGSGFQGELRLRRPDGQEPLWMGWSAFLVRDPASSEPLGVAVMGRDLTAQKRAEAERERLLESERAARQMLEEQKAALAKSNAELDQFAYVASHDLKAPLRGIANLSQWIEEDLGPLLNGETKENMELLRGRVHRLEALINGILSYSRAGRMRSEAEATDVGKLLRETIELLSPAPHVRVEVRGEMPTLHVERVPFQQVFMNLIGNALKHVVRPDPHIVIAVAEEGRAFHFTVSDNGPGISAEYFERIWGIFQTLSARDDVEGTGIGLSVVKKIVETRGGRAWVTSELGNGATFHVLWPK